MRGCARYKDGAGIRFPPFSFGERAGTVLFCTSELTFFLLGSRGVAGGFPPPFLAIRASGLGVGLLGWGTVKQLCFCRLREGGGGKGNKERWQLA